MIVRIFDEEFSICKLNNSFNLDIDEDIIFTYKGDEDSTLICKTIKAPENVLDRDDNWRCIRTEKDEYFYSLIIDTKSDKLVELLDNNQIEMIVVNEDQSYKYIFVKVTNFNYTIELIKKAGFIVVDEYYINIEKQSRRYQLIDSSNIDITPLLEEFSLCKLKDLSQVNINEPNTFITNTFEGLSLVCPTHKAPKNTKSREDDWKAFRIYGRLDYPKEYHIAKLSKILYDGNIEIFIISTYNSYYFFMKKQYFKKAVYLIGSHWMPTERG